MDFFLTQTYRKVYHDLVLMYDVFTYCQRRNLKGKFIDNFAAGLATVLSAETNIADVPVPANSTNLETDEERKQMQWEMFLEFVNSVVIQFSCEELSQYPYWAAKISTAIADDSLTATSAGKELSIYQACTTSISHFFSKILNTLLGSGPVGLYEGCVPFLSAAIIYNYSQLQASVQRFVITMMATIPHHPLRKSSSKTALPPLENPNQIAKATVKKSNTSYFTFTDSLLRSASYIVMYPFLLVSVRIVADPVLRRRNWMSACINILRREGVAGFFSGFRNTVLLSILPFSPFMLLGLPDTMLYHILLNGSVMTSGSKDSLIIAFNDILSAKGIGGLAIYGAMTAAQAIPGFLSFLSTRFSLWMLMGTTKQRKRQFARRRQFLDDCFTQPMHRVTSAVNFNSAPVDGDTPHMFR